MGTKQKRFTAMLDKCLPDLLPTLDHIASAAKRRKLQAQIDALLPAAETGEQWAEICRLEAEMNDGPWFDGSAS